MIKCNPNVILIQLETFITNSEKSKNNQNRDGQKHVADEDVEEALLAHLVDLGRVVGRPDLGIQT